MMYEPKESVERADLGELEERIEFYMSRKQRQLAEAYGMNTSQIVCLDHLPRTERFKYAPPAPRRQPTRPPQRVDMRFHQTPVALAARGLCNYGFERR